MKEIIENLIALAEKELELISNKIHNQKEENPEETGLFIYWAARIKTLKEVLALKQFLENGNSTNVAESDTIH